MLATLILFSSVPVNAAKIEGTGKSVIPLWFKHSFLDLRNDIASATRKGKRVMVYFHQEGCPYCAELVNNNFSQKHIVDYMNQHIDAIEINMWGDREVMDTKGKAFTEKTIALHLKVWFTPTVLFFDESGKIILRINGYYPPDKFMNALKYVATRQEKKQSFRDYYAKFSKKKAAGKLHAENFYIKPPYHLEKMKKGKPVAVFFEQRDCPGCDTLHSQIFKKRQTLEQINRYQVIQLDMWSNTPITTFEGKKTTARKWARKLGITYAPSAVFFVEGKEVIRIEAFLKAFHVQSVMDYAASGAYKKQPSLQRFIQHRAEKLLEKGERVDLWK